MEQVEEICEYIALINQGQKVLEGKVSDVKQDNKDNLFKVEYEGSLPDNLSMLDEVNNRWKVVETTDKDIIIKVEDDTASNLILNHLLQSGVHIHSFNEILPTLNEIFIKQVEG